MERLTPLLSWIRETNEATAQAALVKQGTTLGYIRQVAYGHKCPSGEMCAAIERATGVSRMHTRPHDWRLVWPELAEKVDSEKQQGAA